MELPKYSYDFAVYKIKDIKFYDRGLRQRYDNVHPDTSYVGLDIKDNVGNEKSICHVLSSGDASKEQPNFMFFLPNSFDSNSVEYDIIKITEENVDQYEDELDPIDYELLSKIHEKKYREKILDHFVKTDIANYYGMLSSAHMRSKKVLDELENNSRYVENEPLEDIDTGIEIDHLENITPTEVNKRLDYLYKNNYKVFSSIISLIINTTK